MVAAGLRLEISLFAVLKDRLGGDTIDIELPEGSVVGQLRKLLIERFPDSRDILTRAAVALNEEYVSDSQQLRPGDKVALVPPVSGGDGLILVTREELSIDEVRKLVRSDEDGAICLFLGVVRNHNDGKAVTALEYDAYVEMAERQLAEVAAETRRRFPVSTVALHHRIGRLAVGDVSLLAAVSSHHRKEAFDACHWAVDRLKQRVPIWKKEFGPDGAVWLEGHPVATPATDA